MWKLLFLLIVTAAASDDEGELGCSRLVRRNCDDKTPNDWPETEDEVDEFCKSGLEFFGCATSYVDQCHEDENEFGQFMQEIHSTLIRVCDKESLLYSAIVESMPCIKKNARLIGFCPGLYADSLEDFSDALSNNGITDVTATDVDPTDCLTVLYGASCFSANTGKICGNVAKDVMLDIIQGVDLPFSRCRSGVKDLLPAIVEVMQLEGEKIDEVENMIKRKK